MKKIAKEKNPLVLFKILFSFLLVSNSINAQKIVVDQTDPFTNVRSLSTSISNLKTVAFTAILQVASTLDVKGDSIIDYKISFVMPDFGTNVQTNDTSTNFFCLIKTDLDSVIKGQYISTAQFAAGTKLYQGYTYTITASDFNMLKNHDCTDIKFIAPNGHQGLVQIDSNAKDRISKQFNVLLDKIE